MTLRRKAAAVTAGMILAVAAVATGTGPAWAHDALVAASPAADQTVDRVTEATLTFSGVLLGAETGGDIASVTGPDGRFYETDCAAVRAEVMTVPVALGGPGVYRVDWRAVSSDGHPVSGSYTFSYAPAPGTAAAPGSASSPCAGVASNAEPVDTEQPSRPDSGVVVALAVGAGVVVVVGAVVVLILLPRKRPTSSRD